jgi:DNA-binding transcriptional LysR family regulator
VALSLDLLRTFLTVYREGSLTRAAERLSLAQPTVTVQIRTLEAALGRPLFDRLPRGVSPTAAADLLARRIAAPLDELGALGTPDPLAGDFDGETSPLAGVVHLGGPVEFVTSRVLPALAELVGQGLELRVSLGVADDLVRGLESGAVDIAVLTTRPRRRGLRAEPLCDEEFVLVASAEQAQRIAGGDVVAALAGVPLISYAEALPIVRRYWRTVFGARPAREAAVVVPDLRAVLAAVLAGAGYSVLPTYLCAEEIAAGRLVILHDPPLAPLNTLYLGVRAGSPASAAATAVHDRLLSLGQHW